MAVDESAETPRSFLRQLVSAHAVKMHTAPIQKVTSDNIISYALPYLLVNYEFQQE